LGKVALQGREKGFSLRKYLPVSFQFNLSGEKERLEEKRRINNQRKGGLVAQKGCESNEDEGCSNVLIKREKKTGKVVRIGASKRNKNQLLRFRKKTWPTSAEAVGGD